MDHIRFEEHEYFSRRATTSHAYPAPVSFEFIFITRDYYGYDDYERRDNFSHSLFTPTVIVRIRSSIVSELIGVNVIICPL